jgi:hypothetical protein
MADARAATVPLVDEAQATGKVAELFANIKKTKHIDFIPRFWLVHATNFAGRS